VIGDGGAARARHMLGNYEILETLGSGGMGVVYRAHDHTLDRTVALKVLRDDLRVQAHLVTRFQREARAVAALDHPNIVQVYSVGAIDEIPYIAMEFVEGRALNKLLKKRRPFDWEYALGLAAQVARGLAAAHEKGIYHRDIKPANILVDGNGRAYLTDFGIAKIMNAETQLTVDGSRLGTPHYMAPERCEGMDAGNLSDIYSIGVVLHQMLTGNIPFDAQTPAGLIEQILAKPILPVSRFRDDVPEDVDRLVAWITEKEPHHRPQDAHQLAEAIERVAAGMPLEEDGPNLAGALAEFRESVSTPAPAPSDVAAAGKDRVLEWWTRAYARWTGWPYLPKVAGVAAAAGIAAFFVVRAMATDPPADYAAAIAREADMGLSRWEAPGVVGQFYEESPGVYLITLNTPDFVPKALARSADTLHVLLDGTRAGGMGAAQLVMSIAPDTEEVELVRSPATMPAGEWTDVTVSWQGDAALVGRIDEQAALFPLGDWRHGIVPIRVRDGAEGDYRIGSAEVVGDGVVAAVSDDSAAGCQLAHFGLQNDGAIELDRFITRQGGRITAIAADPVGEWLVYLREGQEEGSERSVFAVLADAQVADGRLLAGGDVHLPANAVHPLGEHVAVVERRDGGRAVRVAPLTTDGEPVVIEGAVNAAWSNDGQLLFIIAPDVYGNNQVWAVRVGGWADRRQRTFLTGGVSDAVLTAAGGSGALAVAPESGKPSLVWVDGAVRRALESP